MASLAHHFLAMAYNNAWANHRLLKACDGLSQADFAATRTSFFPSIKATLNHNLTVDWYYFDALERSLSNAELNSEAWKFFEPEQPCETCLELRREQTAADKRLVALCQMLNDASMEQSISVPRRDHIQVESVSRLLPHLFQHQIHHRGQVHAMLAGTSVKPPQLDEFFAVGEAPLRASDFQELGFSEEEIWGK